MFTKSKTSLLIQVTGLLFFGILFFLSWIFFKERMLSYDPAFYSFRMIIGKTFDVELGRWGAVVSQLLPLWFLKNGCTLETFLKVYSVSFILIYYAIFLLITRILRNNKAGVALMVTLCLAFRHAFYFPNSELYQALALCILVWALAFPETPYGSLRRKNIAYFFSAALVFVISYFHQLAFFPLMFIFLFQAVHEKKYTDRHVIFLFLFTVLWFFIRVKFLTTSDYEKNKIPTLQIFADQLKNLTELPGYIYLKTFARHFLMPLIVLNAVCLFAYAVKRKWISFLLIVVFNAGFIFLNLITFYRGESPLMYENYYTVLGLFCAIPLSTLLINLENKKLFWLITSIILLINLKGIYTSREPFTQRVEYMERITGYGRTMPEKKYIIDVRNFPWKYSWGSWALPFETLLSSSLKSPDSAVTVCVATPVTQYDSIANWENVFLGPAWAITWFWTPDLDPHYYKVPSGSYRKLTNLQSDSAFNESAFNNQNVFITPLQNSVELNYEKHAVIRIRINNSSGRILNAVPDGPHPVYLSYHVYNEKGEMVEPDGYRTALETDVGKESVQGLVIIRTLTKGKYVLVMDFVTENVRWWNINAKADLIVK